MDQASRSEVEKFARERFHAGLENRIKNEAQQKAEALARARSTHNFNAYPPALVACAQEKLRESILALADAWVEAGTLHQVALEKWAEETFETAVLQMAGGALGALRGELDLQAKRLKRQFETPSGREIEQSMNSALREGKLRLNAQRLKFTKSKMQFDVHSPEVTIPQS
jgi:hypothetical protein